MDKWNVKSVKRLSERYTRETNEDVILLRWAVAWWCDDDDVEMTLKQTVVYWGPK